MLKKILPIIAITAIIACKPSKKSEDTQVKETNA